MWHCDMRLVCRALSGCGPRLTAAVLVGLLGCRSDPEPPRATPKSEVPAAVSAASAVAAPSAAAVPPVTQMRIEPLSGNMGLVIVAPNETIKGRASLITGMIDLDLADVTRTRGSIGVDLTTLKMSSFGDPAKDKKQSDHAQAWLEIVGDVAPSFKERYRYATFAIREVVAIGEHRVDKWPSTKGPDGEVRTAAVTVKGDLGVHGKSVAKEIPMVAILTFRTGETIPIKLEMRSTAPMTVTLAQHDIAPKDLPGMAAKGLLGKRVGETAELSIGFLATPAPKAMPAE